MYCPVCKEVELKMSDRQGIEIDYCPECRGVWLDRGELDKIIERTSAPATAAQPYRQPQAPAPTYRRDDDYYDDDDSRKFYTDDPRYHGDAQKRKRRGMLGEIFDIFD